MQSPGPSPANISFDSASLKGHGHLYLLSRMHGLQSCQKRTRNTKDSLATLAATFIANFQYLRSERFPSLSTRLLFQQVQFVPSLLHVKLRRTAQFSKRVTVVQPALLLLSLSEVG